MRNDEVKGRRDEERLFADIERILKTNQILARHLNRKNIDRPELRVIHIPDGILRWKYKTNSRTQSLARRLQARKPDVGHWILFGAGCLETAPSA
jgi:hypothetical protein